MKPIIKSILDGDLYKFSMQQAVLELFPNVDVEYKFNNRGEQRFTPAFLSELKKQVQLMSVISLSTEEYCWIKENIAFFKPQYIEYLKNYSYNPDEVDISLDYENNLNISIKGKWHTTILWEVTLMSLISELYFSMIDKKWNEDDIYSKVLEKSKILGMNDCVYTDFGTRRRRSYSVQDKVIYSFLKICKKEKIGKFAGTSNVHFSMKYNLKPKGTMAHEWIMGNSVMESLRHSNYYALQNWVKVYNIDLGIALTDTFGTDAFFKSFNKRLSKLYDGVRHDSGDPILFGEKVISHYEKMGIDPKSKTIIFSDGLNPQEAVRIHKYFTGKIQVAFGIGTNFTNDFDKSPALNMVIKLWKCDGIPVVKLSDVDGKVMGDPDAVKVAKWTFFNEKL